MRAKIEERPKGHHFMVLSALFDFNDFFTEAPLQRLAEARCFVKIETDVGFLGIMLLTEKTFCQRKIFPIFKSFLLTITVY